jgi:hypothetical protein
MAQIALLCHAPAMCLMLESAAYYYRITLNIEYRREQRPPRPRAAVAHVWVSERLYSCAQRREHEERTARAPLRPSPHPLIILYLGPTTRPGSA